MGFKLGRFLGKVAGTVISQATGGRVRPTFQRPSQPGRVAFPVEVGPLRFGRPRFVGPPGGAVGGQVPAAGPAAGCPAGFRLNKSTYVTRGGGTSRWPQSLTVHQKGTECVRRRKVNAGNGRAATRAVRRLVSFYRLSNRVARQLRRAASSAKIGRGRGQRRLPAGGGSVQVIDTD